MKATIRFFTEDGRKVMRLVDPRERLELLASEQAEKVFRPDGTTDGSIKLVRYAPEDSYVALPVGVSSSCGLTARDSFVNAAGCIDTEKKREVYRMRERAQEAAEESGEECKSVPAAIRCYGHNAMKKPDSELVGNGTDRAMSRVAAWPRASTDNRSVTVVPRSASFPAGVIGLRTMEPEEFAALRPLAL
jgi:hypothetical protein